MSIENIAKACKSVFVCLCLRVSKYQLHLLSKYMNRCASICIRIESTMQCNIKWYFLDLKHLSLSLSLYPSFSFKFFYLYASYSFYTCIVCSFVRGFNSKSLNRFYTCGIRCGDEHSTLILLLHFSTHQEWLVLGGSKSGNETGKRKAKK